MNFTVRFIGSLIKYFIYLCIILVAAGAAMFWFDTGSWLVLPLAQRAGNFFLNPMKLEIKNITGSLRNGYSLEGLRLFSGDRDILTLNHISISPDWDLVLSGMNGLPFVKSLNVKGMSSDLDSAMTIAEHFDSDTSKDKDSAVNLDIKINPVNIALEDIYFGTPYANLSLDAITLDEAGKFFLNAQVFSGDKVLPLRTNAQLNFSPVEVISSDIFIGRKGTGKFSGTLEPLKARLDLTALSLDEFIQFAPSDIRASGRIDGRLSAESRDGVITTSGVLAMPRANIMDIPLNFRLPFTWNSRNTFTLNDATLNTNAAGFTLSASGDIPAMKFSAKGEGRNISLTEIGSMFAPDAALKGERGYLRFDADTHITGDIMQDIFKRTNADVTAEIPDISAMGINAAENLSAHINLKPNETPRIAMSGRAFGGKIFARGEAVQDGNGGVKPDGVIMSIVGLDIPTLCRAVPQLSGVVQNPSGKITARAKISEALNIAGKITSDKLSAYGVTLSGLEADVNYDIRGNTAELDGFTANFGKGRITASGGAEKKQMK